MTKGKISIKTIIVLVILLLVGVLSILGMGAAKTYLSGASAGSEPKGVLATPGEDGRSASVSWTTDKAVQSVIEYGTTPASLLLRSLESDATTTHSVPISPLKPNTSYYFRVRVGEEVFDNSGIPYSFKTKASAVEAVPTTIVPTVALVPTTAASESGCNRTTDYNGDGIINSIDFITCIKGGGKSVVPVPSVASKSAVAGDCTAGIDYDGNGVINTLDRIKCLQKKN